MTQRTTIRIDHEEDDPYIKKVISDLRARGYTTTHLKGLSRTAERDGIQ